MLCNIALSLLHRLSIVHLDEPTVGLDIVVKKSIRDFFFHINREHGVSIILTSHDLEDMEKLCLRIIVIDKGKMLFDDSLEKPKNIMARRGPCFGTSPSPAASRRLEQHSRRQKCRQQAGR